MNASIELQKISKDNPLEILEILAASNFTSRIGADIVWLSDLLQFLIYPAILLSMLVFLYLRRLYESKFNAIQVSYLDGAFVNVSEGSSHWRQAINVNATMSQFAVAEVDAQHAVLKLFLI